MSTSADNYISTSKGESSREGIVIHPTNLKRDPKSFQTDIPITADCLFCVKDAKKRSKEQFSSLVVKALYSKYSSSQNYYYTKDINEMLAEMKSSAVILFKDYIHFDEEEEYLKRYYQIHEYDFKIKMLTEYYKFHNEIARIFMHPITHVVNRFHDKKRRLEYIRVTNMLKVEQGQPELQEPEEEKKEHQDYIITDRILDDLQFTEQDSKEVKSNPYILHNEQLYFSRKLTGHEPNDLSSKVSTAKNQQVIKNADAKKNPQKNINTQSKDVSVSSTLHDINAKLGEIISNSRSYNPESYYLENNESLPNETITNLDSFLVFLKKNPQDYKALEIQKLIPKKQASKNVVSSSTADKMNRQESARIAPKLKQTPKGETALKISDSHVKNVSPMVKAPVKILKSHERSKETSEERSINPSTGNKHQDLDVRPSRPKSGTATVTKIKNFEEAIKINTQDYQQKMTIHTSLPRESQVLPSTPKNRTSSSRTPNKQGKEKSYGSKTRPQTSAANSTKSTMRSKTKSTDIYTKTLDLLLGSNQILLNSQVQKKEIVTQNNLKNSFNFKSKTPNQIHMHHQDKSLGRDDGRGDSALSSSNIKIMSNKVSADRISLQTDRGSKKSGMFGLDIHKKDVRQAPLSDRQLSKDSIHRSKEFSGKSNKKSLKVSIMTQSESENMKPEFAPYADFNKLGLHKYTKSESRTKKSAEKERKDSATKASSIASNKKLKVGSSPKKHGSPSKHSNNMAGVFPSSSTGKRSERSSALKGDRQPEQDGMSHRNDGSSRNVKSRPSRSELFTQFHQSLIKQLNGVNLNNDYRNLDLSPLRMNQKDNIVTRQTPILSDRSPINFNTGYQYQTPNKKELDLIQKGLNLENFENLVNQRKNRKVNNFFK